MSRPETDSAEYSLQRLAEVIAGNDYGITTVLDHLERIGDQAHRLADVAERVFPALGTNIIEQIHVQLDRFGVPPSAMLERVHEASLLERLSSVLSMSSKRAPAVLSAEIDKIAESKPDFAIKRFYGMEFRGLLGDIVESVNVEPLERLDPALPLYRVSITFRATCTESGIPNRQIIGDTTVEIPAPTTEGLTDEQRAIRGVIYKMIDHELAEDLRIDGVPIAPQHHLIR